MKFNSNEKIDKYFLNPQRYNTVIKSNDLIQKSRFSLSTQQQKIVLFIISQIEPFDNDFNLFEFKITEFCNVCGIEPQGNMYNLLKKAIKDISDKSLWITLDNGKETIVRWIEKPTIDKKSGTIQIKLDNDMKPYLLQLKEKFTKYELIYTLNFKSKYSIRLYEYLKSIHYKELEEYKHTIEINKFQTLLDSKYDNFKDFHTRVLKAAHKEINLYSDLIFDYDFKKDGRKITDIVLKIKPKDAAERFFLTKENEKELEKGALKNG